MGVAVVIVPWNSPTYLGYLALGPILMAGNTVVVKPPTDAPLGAHGQPPRDRAVLPARHDQRRDRPRSHGRRSAAVRSARAEGQLHRQHRGRQGGPAPRGRHGQARVPGAGRQRPGDRPRRRGPRLRRTRTHLRGVRPERADLLRREADLRPAQPVCGVRGSVHRGGRRVRGRQRSGARRVDGRAGERAPEALGRGPAR